MTAAADPHVNDAPARRTKTWLPLLIGAVLAVAGGAGGYFLVKSGIVTDLLTESSASEGAAPAALAPVAFVALDPLVVNLPAGSGRQFLRFAAQLEVPPQFVGEVEAIKPRIIDVLNGYLRVVEAADLADPTALMRLRSQMLRRVQIVTGEGRVRDLLIMEFVIN